MATGDEPFHDAEAAGSSGGAFPSSSLPWHQIPKFEPGVTEMRTYSRKLEFLRNLWPQEHIQHLAPRAALMVEGVAFQKVARLDTDKLKSADGVKYLVEALGGQWGRLEEEDRYDLFERALYGTIQKADESNDSFLNRHDVSFEDLLGRNVQLEEVRAYVMIRQSALSPEDRKKVIMESGGKLKYDVARRSIRLLGSKFFQDLQGQGKAMRQKTYDVNHVDETEETTLWAGVEPEMDEEQVFQTMLEEGDTDALFVQDFEEQIILTCQEAPDLASCFTSYQEARDRLKEKAKSRGFWPLRNQNNSKGKSKGGKKGKNSWGGGSYHGGGQFKRRNLADRIANSICKRCLQPGHWKRECPLLNAPGQDKEKTAFTGVSTHDDPNDESLDEPEIIDDLPETVWLLHEDQVGNDKKAVDDRHVTQEDCCFQVDGSEKGGNDMSFGNMLISKLQQCCRNHSRSPDDAVAAASLLTNPTEKQSHGAGSKREHCFSEAVCLLTGEEASGEAIIDTGASRAVIGEQRLHGLVESLPKELKDVVRKTRTSGVTFKFGNSARLTSVYSVLLPRCQNGWIRVEVVPGQTPFLISNSILKGLRSVVDVEDQVLMFKGSQVVIPLKTCRKNLLSVDVAELLMKSPGKKTTDVGETIMTAHETENGSTNGDIKDTFVKEHTACHVGESTTPSAIDSNQSIRECVNDRSIQDGLPHREAGLGRGSTPECAAPAWRHHAGQEATRHRDSGGVGNDHDPSRETQWQDVQASLRTGTQLHPSDVEPQRSQYMGTQFPDVLSSSVNSTFQVHPSSGGSVHGGVACTTADASASSDQVQEGGASWIISDKIRSSQLNVDVRLDSGDRQGQQALSGSGDIQSEHAGGTGREPSREDSRASDPDRSAATRVSQDDSSATRPRRDSVDSESQDAEVAYIMNDQSMPMLTPNEEQMIHEAIQTCCNNIEDGLSVLPTTSLFAQGDIRNSGRQHKFHGPTVDLMEIYCEPNSQLVHQVNSRGGRAIRFTKEDGDLQTTEGVQKLWTWIHMYEPKHIWVAPECRLWGMFSRFNMGRSETALKRILRERDQDRCHLQLCNDLYLHQVGCNKHFHLEQPVGSEMIAQPELEQARLGTLPATFDMCQVGKLRLPKQETYLQKRTQVFTTSRNMFDMLHQNLCTHTWAHTHQRTV